MPKGLHRIDLVILERFRAKVAQTLNLSLNSNKNYDYFSQFIFQKTHVQVSPSTLRRVFQYDSHHIPTKSTLDLVSQSIGFVNWNDFIEKEQTLSQYDISQLISAIQLGGNPDQEQITKQIVKFKNCSNLFNLLEVIVQAAIAKRDIKLLSELFDLPDIFTLEQDSLKIYFFVHNLVSRLNQAGLMSELIPYYGASTKAQVFLVEWYVDEDNLNGYYYDLLQEYHKHKTNLEAQLFYNCLMYQHAILKDQSIQPWFDSVRDFVETEPVHPIPKARRLGTLMLETEPNAPFDELLMQEVSTFFEQLNEDDKIVTALKMIRLLYIKRRASLITFVLKFVPNIIGIEKNIWARININQLRIYRAYSYLSTSEKENAKKELEQFDSFLVNNFIHNIIMNDYNSVVKLID
jgi:hypothetical protein